MLQGAVILLGKTNMFRYNNPAEAQKLKSELKNVGYRRKMFFYLGCAYCWSRIVEEHLSIKKYMFVCLILHTEVWKLTLPLNSTIYVLEWKLKTSKYWFLSVWFEPFPNLSVEQIHVWFIQIYRKPLPYVSGVR